MHDWMHRNEGASPDDARLRGTRTLTDHRVIAVSLTEEEAGVADRITAILRQAGWPNANRSLVMREGLLRLEEELAGKSPKDVFRYFVDRYARRAGQLPTNADHDPH